jgi:hypothetical protein
MITPATVIAPENITTYEGECRTTAKNEAKKPTIVIKRPRIVMLFS